MRRIPLLYSCFLLLTLLTVSRAEYAFQTGFYNVSLDHFSYTTSKTFPIKYLYNDTFWNRTGNGPIFFYTGNEGLIEVFAQNAGLMWDLAPKFGALLLFAEHRYYGASMPFGNESFSSPEKSGFLTSEQALADFAQFLTWYKNTENATLSPVIAFGGSYGGMLTAWMRMKYPHIVQGGIAASAPIAQFEGLTPCNKYNQIVSSDFQRASVNCHVVIRKSWDIINQFAENEAGRDWISQTFRMCKPLKTKTDITTFKEWLTDVYGYLAMIDYPYENSFLEPVPGNPVNAVCNLLASPKDNDKTILKSIFKGVSIYFNYTGQAKCLDWSDEATGDLGAGGWDFQACTEMIMPMCSDGINDMFEPNEWDLEEYSNDCFKRFGVRPNPEAAKLIYGGRDINAASNIVFSNGLLDPWYGGGILNNVSDSLIAVVIPEGAHHLDLRSSHPKDPPSVITARKIEEREIAKWIKEFHSIHKYEVQRLRFRRV